MKREEVLGIFPEATDEQVDGILNGIAKELNPLKASLASATSQGEQASASLAEVQQQAAAYKAALDEANAKLADGMSAEELLAQREMEAAQRERDFTMKSNALDAKAILVASGYFGEEEVEALVARITTEDADATKAFAESLVAMVKSQRESVEQDVKNDVLGASPKLAGSGGNEGMTKEKFDAMSYEDQAKALQENPGLLKKIGA